MGYEQRGGFPYTFPIRFADKKDARTKQPPAYSTSPNEKAEMPSNYAGTIMRGIFPANYDTSANTRSISPSNYPDPQNRTKSPPSYGSTQTRSKYPSSY